MVDCSLVRLLSRSACGTILALGIPSSGLGQENAAAIFSVPFVGCRSDGQVGPVEVPKATSIELRVSSNEAQHLAYYKSGVLDTGVLAPRGWHCFAVYGSGGASLLVIPQPVESIWSAEWDHVAGPAIEVNVDDGDTSGRYTVAEIIGRVFPAFRDYAKRVLEDIDGTLPSGPYSADVLSYRSKTVVEYKTPAEKDGLGTRLRLQRSPRPIEGVAVLFGQPPSLLQLAMRLPNDSEGLASAIIAQFERDASSLIHN